MAPSIVIGLLELSPGKRVGRLVVNCDMSKDSGFIWFTEPKKIEVVRPCLVTRGRLNAIR